jgi:hypothetical protein
MCVVFIWAFGHLFAWARNEQSKVVDQVFAKIAWQGQRMTKKF